MSVPDFQSFFLPVLKTLFDEKEYQIKDIRESIANYFKLTEDEINERIQSGTETKLSNRVSWTITYFYKAGLVSREKRGVVKITSKGKKVLAENPNKIDIKYLKRFNEFNEFAGQEKIDSGKSVLERTLINGNIFTEKTPFEIFAESYEVIRKNLTQELHKKIVDSTSYFFEKLVLDLLLKLGYGYPSRNAGIVTSRTKDEGIDCVIYEDKLGLDIIYVQAKRWEGVVGRPEIQKFVGALAGQKSKKGVFITSSSYTKEAINYAKGLENKVVLISGEELAQFMIEYDLGVSTIELYKLKKVDNDYFDESNI